MAEIKVEFGDNQSENWQPWVMPDGKKEYDQLPEPLKPLLRSLARRPAQLTPPGVLLDYYERIDKLAQDPESKAGYGVAGLYLGRITKQLEEKSTTERRAALRELPLHIGAVFKNGRNELLVEHPSIPVLEIKNAGNRRAFIFENIHAFDTLFKQPQAWKPAVDIWLTDAAFAARADGFNGGEFSEFERQVKEMMAVTASARAMEASAGVAVNYLVILTGGEKGNLDAQDLIPDFIIHDDPKKLNHVLDDPLVKIYYERLMRDAGLINDAAHRWREAPDPSDSKKPKWWSSWLKFRKDITPAVVREGILGRYLKEKAKGGGFDEYINEVLLAEDSGEDIAELKKSGIERDSRWAAARIACDAFLLDQWTRWEDMVSEGEKLDWKPSRSWGGDPLKAILKPSFLPRLKGVYGGDDKPILDMMDLTFKPADLFLDKKYSPLMQPSMVTNLKTYARYSEALFTFVGGSMATGIPMWDRTTMEEGLPKINDLLVQVYGKEVDPNDPTNKELQFGKHLVGTMMMRLLYTKALAATLESAKPGFKEALNVIFNPTDENRPFLGVMQYLYGPNLDGKSGFIRSLVGGRTRVIIGGNQLGAEKYYRETWTLLQSNDQTMGRYKAQTLNQIGMAFDIIKALAGNTSKRR